MHAQPSKITMLTSPNTATSRESINKAEVDKQALWFDGEDVGTVVSKLDSGTMRTGVDWWGSATSQSASAHGETACFYIYQSRNRKY
jgi:hypothetical protein